MGFEADITGWKCALGYTIGNDILEKVLNPFFALKEALPFRKRQRLCFLIGQNSITPEFVSQHRVLLVGTQKQLARTGAVLFEPLKFGALVLKPGLSPGLAKREQKEEDLFFAGKIVEDRADTEPGLVGNLADAGVVIAVLEKETEGGGGNALLPFLQPLFVGHLRWGFAFFS